MLADLRRVWSSCHTKRDIAGQTRTTCLDLGSLEIDFGEGALVANTILIRQGSIAEAFRQEGALLGAVVEDCREMRVLLLGAEIRRVDVHAVSRRTEKAWGIMHGLGRLSRCIRRCRTTRAALDMRLARHLFAEGDRTLLGAVLSAMVWLAVVRCPTIRTGPLPSRALVHPTCRRSMLPPLLQLTPAGDVPPLSGRTGRRSQILVATSRRCRACTPPLTAGIQS